MNATHMPGRAAREAGEDPLDQAIAWKLEHDDAALPPNRQAAFQAWLQADAANRSAWRKLEQMDAALAHLDTPARSVVERRRYARPAARRVKHAALCLLLMLGAALALQAHRPLSTLTADYATATAAPSHVVLPDGSQLHLDARSAVDIAFTDTERLVLLRQGTILVQTAPDPAQRPFVVVSRHGRLQALGTRFQVEDDPTGTRLTVLEHAVQAHATHPEREAIVNAEQSLRIEPHAPFHVTAAARDADAWLDGMLVVREVPLEDVVRQFARYRYGHLRVDPQVAGLRVSGTFSLRDTDRSLRALAAQLPIQVRRFSGLWVDIAAAPEAGAQQ